MGKLKRMKCENCGEEKFDNKNEYGVCVNCCAKGQAENPWCEIPSEEECNKTGWEISAHHMIPIELYCPALIPNCPGQIIVTATQFVNRPCHDANHADATHWRFHFNPEPKRPAQSKPLVLADLRRELEAFVMRHGDGFDIEEPSFYLKHFEIRRRK